MKSNLFEKNTVKRSLVLAGGGVRLAYHAGVIKALEETDLSFNHVDGTSGGIFNTAMLASGQNADEIISNWKKLNVNHFVSATPINNYLKFSRINAFGDADGIRKKVFPRLGIDLKKINSNSKFQASFNVCNFSTKEIEAITGEKVTEDHLIAGMSLPIFMPAIKIGHNWYTDAVWVKDANLMEAVKKGAEEIILVYCIGNTQEYLEGSFLQYVHMIEMSAAGGILAELDWLKLVNSQILSGNTPYGQTKPIKIKVIKPIYPLPLDPALFLGQIDITSLINMGYAHAKNNLKTTDNHLVNLDYQATQMLEPGISFQFLAEFLGQIPMNQQRENATINIIFDFRKLNKTQKHSYFYGSIYLIDLDKHICLYDTRIEKGEKGLLLHADFLLDKKVHHFKAKIELNANIDFWLGLEFKTMKVVIDDQKELIFQQNVGKRIKHTLKSKVYFNASWLKKAKAKFEIANWIYN